VVRSHATSVLTFYPHCRVKSGRKLALTEAEEMGPCHTPRSTAAARSSSSIPQRPKRLSAEGRCRRRVSTNAIDFVIAIRTLLYATRHPMNAPLHLRVRAVPTVSRALPSRASDYAVLRFTPESL
jgi:hypothetical protein